MNGPRQPAWLPTGMPSQVCTDHHQASDPLRPASHGGAKHMPFPYYHYDIAVREYLLLHTWQHALTAHA